MSIVGTVSKEIRADILRLKQERNTVILAHNYQIPEVQDLADFVGDSLGLSQQAAKTSADLIVFCGVHFMAETAAILSPGKRVLIPDLEAGCSLAASITAEQLRSWKAEHPDAVVVSYVNTTADVKAESDYCCTSANAVKVVQSIPEERQLHNVSLIPERPLHHEWQGLVHEWHDSTRPPVAITRVCRCHGDRHPPPPPPREP